MKFTKNVIMNTGTGLLVISAVLGLISCAPLILAISIVWTLGQDDMEVAIEKVDTDEPGLFQVLVVILVLMNVVSIPFWLFTSGVW